MDDTITIQAPLRERLASAAPMLIVLVILPLPIALAAMSRAPGAPWLAIPLLAIIPLLGIQAWGYLASRLVLGHDGIGLFDGFSTYTLRHDEIAGYRIGFLNPLWRRVRLRLVPKDPLLKPMTIDSLLFSPVLQPLLDGLVDVTAREREAALAEMLDAAGENGEARFAWIASVAQVLRFAALCSLLLGVTSLLPVPLVAGILAALPLAVVAFHVWAQGMTRLSLTKDPGDPRPLLGIAYCLPALALMLNATIEVQTVDSRQAFIYAGIGGIVLTAVLASLEDYLRRSLLSLAAILVASCAYGYGAALEADVLFDRAPARIFAADVYAETISHGRASDSYWVYLNPWGPVLHTSNTQVPRTLYIQARTTRRVCMALRPGALGMRWYVPQAC
jgi:hypothetical protein